MTDLPISDRVSRFLSLLARCSGLSYGAHEIAMRHVNRRHEFRGGDFAVIAPLALGHHRCVALDAGLAMDTGV